MISYFLLLFYVLFFIVTFIVTSNGKRLTYASAKANANFVNITVNSVTPISVQLGQKQIRCLKSCLDNASCMSFFYNFLSSECRHFGVDFTDPGFGVPENGWKYYTVVRDCRINGYACPTSTGYTFFADICLCYKYVAIKSTHWQAKQYCANIKGYLIKINRKLKQREMERLLGNDKLHILTSQDKFELLITMQDFSNQNRYAMYDNFEVGDEKSKYKLTISDYSGNAGDSFTTHRGSKFTTKDQDNDVNSGNCATKFKGAWWYKSCHASNLNGLYLSGKHSTHANGVNWYHFKGHYYSLKTTTMMIRRLK
ncbi:Ryncolin-4,Angiopoietin-related protein 1,Ficolin-1-B,Techylectin-5A,Ficolin-2,Ryncolin-1,Tenascin-R,Fibrinogen-like protein 1,Ficolin-1,Fibrinogen C domain-containing protein 1-A,Tenascin-N,Ryncolin-3,Fibrinogen C domain-containing protein 1,Ryncolin-2,Techylectin-5B,Angiopoietin-related protein 2,Microfibril-associated glycoprotein 4,Ficolin-1-A,Tenascin,Fibrinogen C domain-containing protein 1-B,Angiopoietin-4 [Mytilus coruscus]|uniref:Fibrinogen C-terminal domain-containing protein n=1 Tax=Mytilus coruscus TaxID=42192 RepID=A0A6J8D101_MYTCO|nr:Ryncolin-4,Angiopoietin-related protein 1,Ficolin-1-B,Techylectin-5A,Ficolin-2,Ryncolin-1,Tenascin-R,Fibrinogen-like protein 1,Ficolin-1,Fibrinogen C domain-containing protein 1-A,Tenascin-N,Ryncolin-3,Fibrinogen C domain-containing protein 1,Ryncolin-2,Techylectin-5B,Angiopoietin-related protein 2,Microfibril-associated glycoprotein 4,Ficolin-1-A,Tenascin,Fibrinogen C domain-containing protein 1-B,Angiopoietin-4 [Mytilus coruscus]